jgi:hypothetical protein
MKDKAGRLGRSLEDLGDNLADLPATAGDLLKFLKVAVPVGLAAYVGFKAWGIYQARKRA